MLKCILKLGAVSLLAAAVGGTPTQVLAQITNKPAAQKHSAAKLDATGAKRTSAKQETPLRKDEVAKPKSSRPFHGKLAEVDEDAKTIKCGKSVYYITSQTKITKAGKSATLGEGVVGEPVSGYVDPTEDGKMAARTVRFGLKSDATGGVKKKQKDETEE